MSQLKICGPRPTPEAMRKRLGKQLCYAFPALEDHGHYLLEVWVIYSKYPHKVVVKDGDSVKTIDVPSVTSYRRTSGGRIMASWVSRPAYDFFDPITMERLHPKPF